MNAKLKQKSVHALLLAFVVASILFLLPYASVDHDSGFTSSDLEVKETVEENVTNASYVNSDGVITDAIDMGYATVQRTRNANGQVTEEFYLDAAASRAFVYTNPLCTASAGCRLRICAKCSYNEKEHRGLSPKWEESSVFSA